MVHGVLGYAILAHLTNVGTPVWLAMLAALATALTVSWLLHTFVEMPTHRIGQRLAARIDAEDGREAIGPMTTSRQQPEPMSSSMNPTRPAMQDSKSSERLD